MRNPLIYILLIATLLGQPVASQATANQDTQEGYNYQSYLPVVNRQLCEFCYFIDSNNGSDSNSGTKPHLPWKTFRNLDTDNLPPGMIIFLKRNSAWNEKLAIHSSGRDGMPITVTAYGSGAAPILSNTGDSDYNSSVISLYGSYIIIEKVQIQDSAIGINIFTDHNIIRYSEISNIGEGVAISGQYNLITHNYIHDTRMFTNTPDIFGDDWGANGIDIANAHNEISFNRFENTEAFSYDYGTGGGVIELYQIGDYTNIHHNWSLNSAGFMEVSSDGSGSATNVSINYNVIINATQFTVIHTSDNYATSIRDFRVENNTLIDVRPHDPYEGSYIAVVGYISSSAYIFRNNILYISDYWWIADDPFTHQNNIYYLINPNTRMGFTLDPSESIANPQFSNISSYDLHLNYVSPAINKGINLGYANDFDLNPVPVHNAPDLGAFEYQGNP